MLKCLLLSVAAGRVKLAKGYFLGCTLNCMVYNQREKGEENGENYDLPSNVTAVVEREREREKVGPLGL